MKQSLVLSTAIILWSSSVAADNNVATDSDAWKFSITPYIWAVDIDGDIEVGVPAEGIPNQVAHISEKFTGILKHVDAGGIIDIDAKKGKFGFFANVMYVNISGMEVTTSDEFEVLVHTKFVMLSGGASYQAWEYKFNPYSKIRIEPYVGVRYTKNTTGASLAEAPDDPEFSSNYKAHWTEPFIGTMLLFDINQYWSINLAGDVGGINKNQDSYDLIGLISYSPIKYCTISLGYRLFYQYYTTGSGATFFDWKMHESGPIAGLTFRF